MPDLLAALLAFVRRNLPALIAAAIALGSGAGIAIVLTDDDPATPDRTVTIVKPRPAPDGKEVVNPPGPLGAVSLDADQQRSAADVRQAQEESQAHGDNPLTAANPVDVHEDMVDETPAGVTRAEVDAGQRRTDQLAREQLRPPERPAGAQGYSCPAAYVVNQSSLSGRRMGVALHFTVSPPGSLLGIRSLFNRSSSGVSSNRGIELTGRCQTWVPRNRKAWAQGAANSAYFSYEIVTYDRSRSQWLASAILKRGILANAVADDLKIIGAPPRLVDPSGCTWPAGVTDHDRLECGNNHWDVGKHFPFDVFMAQVRRAYSGASAAASSPLTAYERKVIRNAASPRGSGHSRAYWCKANGALRLGIFRAAHRRAGGRYQVRKRGVRYQLLGKSFKKRC